MHFGPDKRSVNYGCVGCVLVMVVWAAVLAYMSVRVAAWVMS